MTEKQLGQQTGNVSDQTKPQTEGSKVSTLPQDGSLDETALDRVSGGAGLLSSPTLSSKPQAVPLPPAPPSF